MKYCGNHLTRKGVKRRQLNKFVHICLHEWFGTISRHMLRAKSWFCYPLNAASAEFKCNIVTIIYFTLLQKPKLMAIFFSKLHIWKAVAVNRSALTLNTFSTATAGQHVRFNIFFFFCIKLLPKNNQNLHKIIKVCSADAQTGKYIFSLCDIFEICICKFFTYFRLQLCRYNWFLLFYICCCIFFEIFFSRLRHTRWQALATNHQTWWFHDGRCNQQRTTYTHSHMYARKAISVKPQQMRDTML